jgi:hypothetical protein
MLFSKALFKQSCKSNAVMWILITVLNCFILACVMMISGSGSISTTKNAFENTIIEGEIDSYLKKTAINYYVNAVDGEQEFDKEYVYYFKEDTTICLTYKAKCETWLGAAPVESNYETNDEYLAAMASWQASFPAYTEQVEEYFAYYFSEWVKLMPKQTDYSSLEAYMQALATWKSQEPGTTYAGATAFTKAITGTKEYIVKKAQSIDPSYTEDSLATKEMLACVMVSINPGNQFDSYYTSKNETIPDAYDVESIIKSISEGTSDSYLSSSDRFQYIHDRSANSSSILLGTIMTDENSIKTLLESLSKYGVSKEKYDEFGYDYDTIKHMSNSSIVTYQARYQYEMTIIEKNKADGKYATDEEYTKAITDMNTALTKDISNSLFNSLPTEVSEALSEVGQMDIYSLIVGSIFFKMAGLLLPIIFMIMASNNLIAGQVETGSMAYILSTGTKRNSVVFTQGIYLVFSMLLMFICTTITSCICLSQVTLESSTITYGKLCLMNLGAFLSLFAMSGICFFTSCIFDRSRKAMAIGGGLSIFFLVATMLGLFGSQVIPSVIRLSALNYFNYASIITLFDVTSIISGDLVYIYKFLVLLGIGLVGYIIGSLRFIKKDLPL